MNISTEWLTGTGQKIIEQASSWLTIYGMKVVGSLLILIFGLWATKLLTRLTRRLMTVRTVEPTLVSFSCNLIHAALVAFVVIAAMSTLGIQTASFVAVLGAAGLAVGLALQGSLANFAAGVMILIFRPFKVGDLIEAAGVLGVVEDLQIFTTQLKTGDNKTIFIPNGKLMGDNIVNFSKKGTRRLDLVIGVGYGADIRKAKEVLLTIVQQDRRVLKTPEPLVAVLELAENSVNFAVRPWVNNEDYWGLHFDLMETIKLTLDREGIDIPFPQRTVHLHQLPTP